VLIRAATLDREMVALLGVDEARLFTRVFALGCALAGLAGALQVPRQSLTTVMDAAIINGGDTRGGAGPSHRRSQRRHGERGQRHT